MKLSDITAWLASEQAFAAGAALYAQLGTNKTYQQLFQLAPTPYSRGVLVRELQALVDQVHEQIQAVTDQAPDFIAGNKVGRPRPDVPAAVMVDPPAPAPTPAPEAPVVTDSPVLLDLRQQLRAVRDERSHLHPQLTAKNLGKIARYGLAARILDLTDQETKLKALEAHVLQHGRLPGPLPLDEVTDQGELRRLLANLRSRRSKLKADPARANEVVQLEANIQLIRNKLTFPHV